MRLLQKEAKKDDHDPKALSCYGLYVPELGRTWLRFVDGRPVSAITTQFLSWGLKKLEAMGKKALLLIWDNASSGTRASSSRNGSPAAHNREVKSSGRGARIVHCLLPKKSPWLNAIEPKWIHGKRKVVEPGEPLRAHELADRESARSSAVLMSLIYPFPKRSPDRALGRVPLRKPHTRSRFILLYASPFPSSE